MTSSDSYKQASHMINIIKLFMLLLTEPSSNIQIMSSDSLY